MEIIGKYFNEVIKLNKLVFKSILVVMALSFIFASAAFAAEAKVTGSSSVFTLMEKKQATVSDLIDVLMIFKNKSIDKLSVEQKIRVLRDIKVIGERTMINDKKPLTRGFAALLFHRALNMKGGAIIKLTGRSQRNCLQDMAYYKVMPESSAKDVMSGPDLVSLLQRAKEYNEAGRKDAAEESATEENKPAVQIEPLK
ncbi:MAG TPA: hypothetical protein PKW98_03280 [Candidatus Wallbacteria bacterium]|nr:MAG: hypothetical protein BWY32_00838 [bacterium ADurb.Bin243]HOD39449.1 hypothetical protein [Candidatus Wallbacteria bacterium]HPG56818.1 hypothetical protein [Candidatus Wallbacteria bacterium]